MKNYFTISEFAKLRGININSLRYYEKLGLLKPAYIDDNNGYRYYSAEQVSLLNKIILCIQLGIPLKEMVEFLDEDGNLESQKLLERGRIVAKERIQEMQNNLDYIEYSLKNIEENREYRKRVGVYERMFEERKVMITDIYMDTDMLEPKKMVSEVSKIYRYAQSKGMYPILPAGQILHINENSKMKFCFFLEILNDGNEKERIVTLPAGKSKCLQVELEPNLDFFRFIHESWKDIGGKTIIVNNVMLEKYSFENHPSELQGVELDGFMW
ncbi:MAG: MerR family transcriptional regulator [Agathobacter sp.]|nr:MerR family transcriptional regulator [Agathobacter sp.]